MKPKPIADAVVVCENLHFLFILYKSRKLHKVCYQCGLSTTVKKL